MRQRRAMAGVKFNAPSSVLGNNEENVPDKTELESLIIALIPHNRRVLSKKLKETLHRPVTALGKTYPSPEELWATDPQFKTWVEEKLIALAKLPNMNINRAVYSLCIYDGKYGWVKPQDNSNIVEEDLWSGE